MNRPQGKISSPVANSLVGEPSVGCSQGPNSRKDERSGSWGLTVLKMNGPGEQFGAEQS